MTFLQEATFRLEKRLVEDGQTHSNQQFGHGGVDHQIRSDGNSNGNGTGNDDNGNGNRNNNDNSNDNDNSGDGGELPPPPLSSRQGAKKYNTTAVPATEGQQQRTGGGRGGHRFITGGGFDSERFSGVQLKGGMVEGAAGGNSGGGGSGRMRGGDGGCDYPSSRPRACGDFGGGGSKHTNTPAVADNFLRVINRARGLCSDDSKVFGAWDS